MKKAFYVCILTVLLLCSCTKNPQNNIAIQTGEAFSCTAEIRLDDKQFICDLTYKNAANAELNITSPKELEGVRFTLSNGELSAHHNNSSFSFSLKNNAVSTAKLIFSALGNAVNSNEIKTDKQNGTSYVEGEISSYKYRLNFSSKTGLPESFEVKDMDLFCKFNDFRFLSK